MTTPTTDRDLLELAAKVAGYSLSTVSDMIWSDAAVEYIPWNPLTDDGDALRLAVELFMFVDSAAGAPDSFGAELVRAGNEVVDKTEPRTHDDPYAAARRAIVRAAAEIGKAMP